MLAAAGLLVAACGGDDDQPSASDDPVTTATTEADDATTTTEAQAEPTTEPDGVTVEVTAVDYGYEGLPQQVDAGTTLTLANDSTAEVHELVAFVLPETEQRTIDEIIALPQDELSGLFAGPPALVVVSPPGSSPDDAIAVLGDGTLTEPGRYLVLCSIPTGAEPAAYLAAARAGGAPPDTPGASPHFAQGMYAGLAVG